MLSIHDIRRGGNKANGQSKDLQRLSRQDLLELLVGQMHEGDELRNTIEQNERNIEDLSSMVERLKDKLNLKDEQIEHLKEKLDLKDEQFENLKQKLNIKDAQIEHLKSRLDDKDATIKRLKGRLDAKDELITRLSDSQNMSPDDLEIFEAREHATGLAKEQEEAKDED